MNDRVKIISGNMKPRRLKTNLFLSESHGLTARDLKKAALYILSWMLEKGFAENARLDPLEISRILVLQPGKIGDFIMTLPFLQAVKGSFPHARVTLVVHPVNRPLAALAGCEVVEYCSRLFYQCLPGQNASLANVLPRQKRAYDLLIDLKGDFSSLWYAWRYPPRYRVDLNSNRMHLYFKKFWARLRRQPFSAEDKVHFIQEIFSLLGKALNKPLLNPSFVLRIPGSRETAGHLRRRLALADNQRLVIFHPGASLPLKRWPLENFAALADRLSRDFEVTVIAVGDKNEIELGIKLKELTHSLIVDAIGKMDLLELAALLTQVSLVVANDSSVAHLAALVGIPVIALFGPVDPKYSAPLGPEVEVIQANIDCSPCLQKVCPQKPGETCMDLIRVEQVYGKAKEKLDPNGSFPDELVVLTKRK